MKKIKYYNEFDYEQVSQTFSNEEPEYEYDEKKCNLVQVGVVDCQAKIESFKGQELHAVLDRFGVDDVVKNCAQAAIVSEPGKIYDGRVKDDLNEYSKLLEHTEMLKDKYGLSPDMTVSEVYKYLGNLVNKNNDFIKKEVEAHEKRTQVESQKESQNIQNVGKEDSQEESK